MIEANGDVAVVTGGSRGIGKSIAVKLASAGHNIAVVCSKADESLDGTVAEIKALGVSCRPYICDVSDFNQVKDTVKNIASDFESVGILVNNAGITRDGLVLRMKPEDFDAVIAVNLKGTFNFIHEVFPYMMKKRTGRIVNISSVVGVMGNAGQANYSASKAGIIGVTKSCAREFASRGVTVNAVAPGYVETAMTAVLPDKIKEQMLTAIPLGRYGRPEDIANAVGFLCSEQASYITGQVLCVDGGMCM